MFTIVDLNEHKVRCLPTDEEVSTMSLYQLTASQIKEKILSRELTAYSVVEKLFGEIEHKDANIKAYLTLNKDTALERAKAIDLKIKKGEAVGKLAGVPIAVKDNLCTKGLKTTCASKILENFVPPYDAHVIERLKEEDAIIIGKTNMDEFAMGSSTENSRFQVTCNPWDPGRIPGGSSGGSAAAVAADMAFLALGSDTGGSIRQPAALCGIVGLKPTYGRVSRYGLVAFGSSLDQIGTLTKDVSDAALLLQVIAGHDKMDSTSAGLPVQDYPSLLDGTIKGLRIGVPKEYFGFDLNQEIKKAVEDALRLFEKLGAEIIDISLPHTEYAVAVYYIIATAEASSNLARYDGVRYGFRSSSNNGIINMYSRSRAEGFGSEVKRRIMLGTYALSSGYYDAYYMKASKVRTLIKNDFLSAFEKADCIICPTSPTPAFKIGEKAANPLEMYLSDIFTIPANLAGIPGISIPCGFTRNKRNIESVHPHPPLPPRGGGLGRGGLPIGMQILGRHFEEAKILNVAKAFEKETDYRKKKPSPF